LGSEVITFVPHRFRVRGDVPSPTEKEYRSRVFAQAQIASEGKRGWSGDQ